MRGLLLLCPVLLVAACNKAPDFDARYSNHAEKLNTTATAIDRELQAQLRAAAAASRPTPSDNAVPTP